MTSSIFGVETYQGRTIEVQHELDAPRPELAYVARVDGKLLRARPSALRAGVSGDTVGGVVVDASAPVLHWATPEAARVAAQRYVRGL